MLSIRRTVSTLLTFSKGKGFIPPSTRPVTLSAQHLLKIIEEQKVEKKLLIEGKIIPDPNESRLLKAALNPECCTLCSLGVDVKHTDVLILSQFVRSDGCMLPRRITGLCRLQQKRIGTMVAMAQKAGLMSILTPPTSKKDPKKRKKWKKFNTYFDESTIKPPKSYVSQQSPMTTRSVL